MKKYLIIENFFLFRQIGLSSNHLFYKQIQILESMLNNFLKQRITPLVLCGVPLMQMFTFYLCIKFHEVFPPLVFLLFPIVFVDSLVINVVVFTLASWVFTKSQKAINLLQKNAAKSGRKSLIKKQIRSYSAMKIKFGSNFVDRFTPFLIQSNVLSQTASLLLIKIK
jgi:hypothetical protein